MLIKNRLFACIAALAATAFLSAMPSAQAQGFQRQRLLMDANWHLLVEADQTSLAGTAISTWYMLPDDNGIADAATYAAPTLDTSAAPWQDATTGQDTFSGRIGFEWFPMTLPNLAKSNRILTFEGVDDNADVYLNGAHLTHHEGWNDPFTVSLDSAWKTGGPNVLAVLVQNTAGGGGITGAVVLGNSSVKLSATSQPDLTPPALSDNAWRKVHLPYDYVIDQKFTPVGTEASHGSLPTPKAWFYRTFTLPVSDKGKSVWIDFDGIYRDGVVFLNGVEVGEHKSGYTPARFDLSKLIRYGSKNLLMVHVDPSYHEGWWYEGGGIYRHVWLNIADPVHVAPWGTYVVSNVNGDVAKPTSATLTITTTMANTTMSSAPCEIVSTIIGPDGKNVASTKSTAALAANGSQNIVQTTTLNAPHLWSVETPNMYSLKTSILRNGKQVDNLTTPFGIRTIKFTANDGFFLNGKRVELQGVCNHEDFAGVGIGMPDSVLAWRTTKLKEMGANAFRTSHDMVSETLLDDCDKQGMLVMDENRHLGDTYAAKSNVNTPYSDLSDLAELIQRDRNHPSVIMWSMCNEEPIQTTDAGARIFKAMMDKVHEYDTTRPITCAMNGGQGKGISLVEDLVGFNYNPSSYAPYHASHPDMPLYGSEIGSTVAARGIYATDNAAGLVSSYPTYPGWAENPEQTWEPLATQPFMAGGFVWTGFDYKGEPTPFGWPDINSNFGLLDEAGFPKDDSYYYKAWWINKPLVHIMPHWTWPGKEGQPIDVYCWGNTPQVELFLNGVSLGVKAMPKYEHAEWSVPYAPGILELKGMDASGKVIATDTVVTAGAPASLQLTSENPQIKADGEEVSMVQVKVLDAKGNVCPTADIPIAFTATNGAIVAGTGNGDPTDHTPDRSASRDSFNGCCLALVGDTNTTGAITVTASSPGLPPARLTVHAVPGAPGTELP